VRENSTRHASVVQLAPKAMEHVADRSHSLPVCYKLLLLLLLLLLFLLPLLLVFLSVHFAAEKADAEMKTTPEFSYALVPHHPFT